MTVQKNAQLDCAFFASGRCGVPPLEGVMEDSVVDCFVTTFLAMTCEVYASDCLDTAEAAIRGTTV